MTAGRIEVAVPGRHRTVRIGGLYRCCLYAVDLLDVETFVGDIMTCRFCGAGMRVDSSGAWVWRGEHANT